MGEQGKVLEHVADLPFARRRENPCRSVKKHLAVQNDPACIRLDQTGDRTQRGCFAATGRAEQNQDVALHPELQVERKIGQITADIDRQHQSTPRSVACGCFLRTHRLTPKISENVSRLMIKTYKPAWVMSFDSAAK